MVCIVFVTECCGWRNRENIEGGTLALKKRPRPSTLTTGVALKDVTRGASAFKKTNKNDSAMKESNPTTKRCRELSRP